MSSLFRKIAALCAIWVLLLLSLPTLSMGAGQSSTPEKRSPLFRFVGMEDRQALESSIKGFAFRAIKTINEQTTEELPETVIIVWAEPELFLEKTGFRPENSAAAASPSLSTIWINSSSWTKSSDKDRQETMTHEMSHILLGNLAGGKELPLWANEGLAMHLARQWSMEEQIKLITAHAFGQLPELKDMEDTFPRDGESQNLAYRMSYTGVSAVSTSFGDPPGSVRRLLRHLADPVSGPAFAQELRNEFRVEGWQLAAEQSLGNRLQALSITLFSSGTIFLIITILLFVAYYRVKAKNKKREELWDEEEAWAESLTDEDVQDIYGDKEERW